MSPRTAVVVGVLAVVIFALAVGVGAGQGQGSAESPAALIDRLGALAGEPATVPLDQIDAGCADEDDPTLLVVEGGLGAACTLVVERDEPLGLVRLQVLTSLVIRAPAPEGDLLVTTEVTPGEDDEDDEDDEVTVAVGEGETSIRLQCPGFGTCQARLVE